MFIHLRDMYVSNTWNKSEMRKEVLKKAVSIAST